MSNARADFFAEIYRNNIWKSTESRSGQGSEIWFTEAIISELPRMLHGLGVSAMLDLPCGDFHWMSQVDLAGIRYMGADIVPELIDDNRRKFESPERQFLVLDIVEDILPTADLIFVRDCFIHFSNELVLKALRNIARSNIRYLCATTLDAKTYPGLANIELERLKGGVNYEYRPVILENPPYSLPEPVYRLQDGSPNASLVFRSIMGVWEVATLRSIFGL
jgi:hypothetical protein